MHGKAENIGATGLRSFIERLERLIEEKKVIAEDMKQVKAEAKGLGFDVKVIMQMIKERAQDPAEVQEWLAICETYRASLGMLGGTPLGEAARRRFEKPHKPAGTDDDAVEDEAPDAKDVEPVDWEGECAKAREQGEQAAKDGISVLRNPYVASDRRRAAWDEGYCSASGGDGMDLPPHLRRPEKPKKDKKGAGDE
jgi:uncharacterized protein (UPF0335 family)